MSVASLLLFLRVTNPSKGATVFCGRRPLFRIPFQKTKSFRIRQPALRLGLANFWMHLGPHLETYLNPVHQNIRLRHTWFPVSVKPGNFGLIAQSFFLDKHADDEDPCLRRSNTISPPPTAPLPLAHTRRSTAFDSSLPRERPQSASTSKWRFLPAFISPTSPPSNAVLEHPGTLVHTKGDVVCLGYNTLDDRGMRRLEGRSDHRPVMGTYVVSL